MRLLVGSWPFSVYNEVGEMSIAENATNENIVIYLCILVTYDKEAGFSYVNKYLHLLETEAPLLLSKQEPGPGVK